MDSRIDRIHAWSSNTCNSASRARCTRILSVGMRSHESFGHLVRRDVAAPQHARREPQQTGFVAADQETERLAIAANHAGHHLRVGGVPPHIRMTCMEIRASR